MQLEVRECKAARCSDTRGARVSVGMCVPQGAPCKRAGGRAVGEVRSGEHADTEEDRAVLCAVLPRLPDSLARHEQRGCGTLLGFRHTARRMLRRAVCGGVGSRGRWSWMRWSRERCGCRLRCSRITVGEVGGGAWPWWAAHPRGDGGEGAPSARYCPRLRRVFCTFCFSPRLP